MYILQTKLRLIGNLNKYVIKMFIKNKMYQFTFLVEIRFKIYD